MDATFKTLMEYDGLAKKKEEPESGRASSPERKALFALVLPMRGIRVACGVPAVSHSDAPSCSGSPNGSEKREPVSMDRQGGWLRAVKSCCGKGFHHKSWRSI